MKVIKGLVLLCLMMLAGCQSEEETSQFLLACKYDAPATIAAMLDNGIDVDGQDKTGLSGLMVAAAENRRDVVELLLKRRAKPNLQTRQGVTALMLAAARGSDTAIIGDLLQAGASVNQTSIDKSTALMSAISDGGDVRNDYQHILAMKKPDAPVEEESTLDKIVGATAAKSLATGNRALMTEDMALQLAPGAFKKNVDEIVALLLKHGADVKAVNASGESAFFLAVDHARSAETITTLANAGADTSLADKSGTTPLMLAAAGDDPDLVLALSASGVEVDKPNREGLTALQVAAGQGAPAVIAALVQMVEIMLKKLSPSLYQALGIFLPLITTNCAVLGVAILMIQKEFTLLQSVTYSVATALGFGLALVLFAGIRERLEFEDVPAAFRGVPIALITASILAMAFMGFSGLV